jgi:hypothetical protein
MKLAMNILARLTAGEIALCSAFWLIALPLVIVWHLTGTCTLVGCGFEDPAAGAVLLAAFALSSVAIPLASLAVWRSAARYPHDARRQKLVVLGARIFAGLTAAMAIIAVLTILYMVFVFIYAAVEHV